MDEATKAHLEAMEARLIARFDTLETVMLERFQAIDNALIAQDNLMRTIRRLIAALIATAGDHSRRITDLENKA